MSDRTLQVPAFLVLTSLAGQPQHGYAVIEDVSRISDGSVRLHTGTLYAVLDRLREAGLIEVDREEIVASRLRRYYRLTEAGAERLAGETAQMQRNARVAADRLRLLQHAGEGAQDDPLTGAGSKEPGLASRELRYRPRRGLASWAEHGISGSGRAPD